MDCAENNLPNGIDLLEIDDLKPLGGESSAAAAADATNSNSIKYPRHQRRSVYLFEKLQEVQEQLKEKELQCENLTKEQLQTGEEVQELTAALFEEANKMVQDANIKRRQAEKQLEDSLMKIEVLQEEVTVLKKLILSPTTPNSPNFIKTPQLVKSSSNSNFTKGHKRSISHHSTIRIVDDIDTLAPYDNEIDLPRREKFRTWKACPTLNPSDPFIEDIIRNEINPCLAFKNDSVGTFNRD
ncbi:hypothetical protein HELRODRAFT_177131 [Helobdella robusta]|uniref:GDP/GTP exchange factor Sec2 N-terminal domain-containing protein n=1 Tax=Helobdella robusta TaxID=6412 RepID=T1FB94_HELRO|nr:hypothetical protein HELRODRAFT_177131 [Helobdella robusta]ESN98250.1 hypothetical protein HELRODRAFT_177131 [Helobdella robusta]